jgi:YHS domain-containing protein
MASKDRASPEQILLLFLLCLRDLQHSLTRVSATEAFSAEHNGAAYYFCSAQCASSFNADADAYAAAAKLNLPGWGQTPAPESVVKQFRRS